MILEYYFFDSWVSKNTSYLAVDAENAYLKLFEAIFWKNSTGKENEL
jgi:hypothetical protein